MLRIRALVPVLTLAWIAVACDESDPTSLEVTGSVTAVVHDSAAVLPENRTTQWPADSMDYDGTLTGSVQAEVYSSTDGWVSLGDPVDVTFDIFCEESSVVANGAAVPVGSYSRARLTLRGFVGTVLPGGYLDGVLTASTSVIVLGGPDAVIVIDKAVTPFDVTEATPTHIAFDLNTDVWADMSIAAAGLIGSAAVQQATRVWVTQ